MVESGEVVKVEKNAVTVRVSRKDECSKCGMCGMRAGMSDIDFKAKSDIDAEVGDTVLVSTEQKTKLLSVFLIFLVPLLLIAGAIGISYALNLEELWILIICVGALGLWFAVLAVIDKTVSKINGFCPTVVRIIKKKGETTNERTD